MSQIELAAFIQTHLAVNNINLVLSGGSAVSFYVGEKYVSKDIDLIADWSPKILELKKAMREIGFRQKARYFVHPDTAHLVEILPGPISVGDQPITKVKSVRLSTGTLRVLTPTDTIKDRLAAYYYWADTESLRQAVWISKANRINIKEITRWSEREKMTGKFMEFKKLRSQS